MRDGRLATRRVLWARSAALCMAIAVLATACQGGKAGTRPASGGVSPSSASAGMTITPSNGAGEVRPDQGISLAASGRQLGTVQVTANGKAIEGELDAGGTVWRSRWPLAPGKSYAVTASATAAGGKVTTLTSRFTTAKAAQTVHASLPGPGDGDTVGVGMPIIVNFSQPVYNKAEIERALEVQTSTPVEGAWRWMDRQRVVFRPKKYWPVGTQVRFVAHLSGARAAKGVYATENLSLNFKVGDEVISTVDTKRFTMTVRRNGKVVRRFPMSAGKGTERRFTTTDGVHVISEKVSPVIFDSTTVGIPKGDPNYYKIKGYYADRISDSGEYVHSAPWSVADQGKRNVSHGCINISPANAKWYYNLTKLGDIVVVTGTDRRLEPDNGYGFFQMSWPQWTAGSALKRPITTTLLKRAT
jgi:lipoprotein-anchoring transpeptidase ErfK/SrfK